MIWDGVVLFKLILNFVTIIKTNRGLNNGRQSKSPSFNVSLARTEASLLKSLRTFLQTRRTTTASVLYNLIVHRKLKMNTCCERAQTLYWFILDYYFGPISEQSYQLTFNTYFTIAECAHACSVWSWISATPIFYIWYWLIASIDFRRTNALVCEALIRELSGASK